MRDVSVRVQDLNHDFPLEGGRTIKILHNNNLVLKRGEIVIMMGRAGAGKTTLLTLILALLSDQNRTATVKAVEELELYALGKDDFKAAVAASPSLTEQLRRVYQSIK
jgi:ABC-type lipoprotein export system ATPase subunit